MSSGYYATDAQKKFLRELLKEAFAHGQGRGGTNLDYIHLERVTKKEASEAISKLLTLKRAGWGRIDVWSNGRTGNLIGTIRRNNDGRFGAYSYRLREAKTFDSTAEAERWIRQETSRDRKARR